MDANGWWTGNDDRVDDGPKDWTAPPLERCAVCQAPIERVSIAVQTGKYTSVVCCSELCQHDLEARLAEPCRDTRRAQGEGE